MFYLLVVLLVLELPRVAVWVGSRRSGGVDPGWRLAAHTHGGQIWPFHYIVRLSQPALAGLSRVRDTWLYVTRGVGYAGPPMRVGAPPEISIIELLAG
ncbi:MAG: hypothetical protein H0V10_07685 [Geodermatophilaceae bacterium]|nr:hypothetical protein [Geodermatophilaceae bacterium]